MSEYVYLIQEREFIKTNEDVYKIGKTRQSPNSRLAGYPKGSKVIFFTEVSNIGCDLIEKNIIAEFDKLYKKRDDYGKEYYEGSLQNIKKSFFDVISMLENNITEENIIEQVNEFKKLLLLQNQRTEKLYKIMMTQSNQIVKSEDIIKEQNIKISKLQSQVNTQVNQSIKTEDIIKEQNTKIYKLDIQLDSQNKKLYKLHQQIHQRNVESKIKNINSDYLNDLDDADDIGLLSFDNTNVTYVKYNMEYFMEMLCNPENKNKIYKVLNEIVSYIWDNPKHPENHNIHVKDLSRNICKVYNGNKYHKRLLKDVVDEIYEIIKHEIETYILNQNNMEYYNDLDKIIAKISKIKSTHYIKHIREILYIHKNLNNQTNIIE